MEYALGQIIGEIIARLLPEKWVKIISKPVFMVPLVILMIAVAMGSIAYLISLFWNPSTMVDWISLICLSALMLILLSAVVIPISIAIVNTRGAKDPKKTSEET